MASFMKMLSDLWDKGRFLCVGLDSAYEKLPAHLRPGREAAIGIQAAIEAFNEEIVRATCHVVCAYKPNFGFYAAQGIPGISALINTIEIIHKLAPGVPVILDGKFGDIGNTSAAYAEFAFDVCGADAVTVNPYLGKEALGPFLERTDKGIFILARTSNPGAGEFQDFFSTSYYEGNKTMLYQLVAWQVAHQWNKLGNLGLVAGATSPQELQSIRFGVGSIPILIPGVGAQGGDLDAAVTAGINNNGDGFVINVSRSIIFASGGEDFAEAAKVEAEKIHAAICACRREVMAR